MGRHYKIPKLGRLNKAQRLAKEKREEAKILAASDMQTRGTTHFLAQHAKDVLEAAAKEQTINHRLYAEHLLQHLRGEI